MFSSYYRQKLQQKYSRGPQACPVNNLIELTELLTELTAVADGADSSWQLTELTTSQIVQISLQHAVRLIVIVLGTEVHHR